MQTGNVPQTHGLRAQGLCYLLRMRDFPEALVQMALKVQPLRHIEVILEFHELATMGKGFPETELKVPEPLEPQVSAQEAQRLKGNFPDILV